jgi:phage shock protein PspC (stress-responsive transcriptional regulator)
MVRMTDDSRSQDGADPGGADPGEADPGEEGPAPRRGPTRGRGKDKVLAGVCAGAGRWFGVDPVIFRVVLAVLSLTGGIGLIIYGTGWLIIPQEGEEESEAHRLLSGRIEGAPLTAVLMALVGCGLYASMLGNGVNQAFSLVLLAATAAAVYWSQQRRRAAEQAGPAGAAPYQAAGPGGAARAAARTAAVPEAPPAVQAPPEPGGPSWWREPLTKEPSYLWGPDDGPYGQEDRRAWKARKKAAREHNWVFALVVFLLAATALCVGAGASWPYQPAPVSAEIGLGAALAVLGAAFVVASFAGKAAGGTVFWSLVVIAGLVGAAMLPKSGQGVGRQTWRPTSAAAVAPSYERGAGTGVLDLSGLDLNGPGSNGQGLDGQGLDGHGRDGRTVATKLHVGAGEAEVRLPRDATVRIDYDVSIGDVDWPDRQEDGVHLGKGRHGTATFGAAPGRVSRGTIDLKVTVGVGRLLVLRDAAATPAPQPHRTAAPGPPGTPTARPHPAVPTTPPAPVAQATTARGAAR